MAGGAGEEVKRYIGAPFLPELCQLVTALRSEGDNSQDEVAYCGKIIVFVIVYSIL